MDRTRTEHKGGIIGRFTGINGSATPSTRVHFDMEEQPCCSKTLALLSGSTTPGDSATGTSTISGEDYDTDTESEETGTVVSLLDRLKSATAADIARPRKRKRNDPPRGKRRCKGAVSSDPKGVTPQQRVREFTNEKSECFRSLKCHLENSRKWPYRTMSRPQLCSSIISDKNFPFPFCNYIIFIMSSHSIIIHVK